MSDFDTVLERLLVDPAFQAALAADPAAALRGYQLAPDERALLGAQVVAGSGLDRTVELRTSKSGVVGLLGPVAAAFGVAAAGQAGTGGVHQSFGGPTETFGGGPTQTFGDGPSQPIPGQDTFGAIPQSDSGPDIGSNQSFGVSGVETFGGGGTDSFGATSGSASIGGAPVEAVGYHTRVDVNGDGRWDAYTAHERSDGGVDINVDVNHDGRVDFIGHDVNRDGLVDSADYDTNRDGVFDTRMTDDNGDGWLDRREPIR
jgi:hypothetical protein